MIAAALLTVAIGGGGGHVCASEVAKPQAESGPARVSMDEIARAIESYVETDSRLKGGAFLLHDSLTAEVLWLRLSKVHQERVAKVNDRLYFACCDFTSKDGRVYDLDFFIVDGAGKILRCDACGYAIRGRTDDELVANAMSHATEHHPEAAAKMKREEILKAAEPDAATGLTVSEIAVHSVDGKARYEWTEKGGLWIKTTKR